MKMHLNSLKYIINQTHKIFSHFVYAQLGYHFKHNYRLIIHNTGFDPVPYFKQRVDEAHTYVASS